MTWTLVDTWTIARRALMHWARQPAALLIGLLFPVLMVVMFGYLLGGQFRLPGGDSYFDFLLPGMLTLTMVFGMQGTMVDVSTDAARGVTDRFRSMPLASGVVVAGRALADMLNSLLALLVLVVAGLVVGWSWHEGVGNLLLALALLLLLRFAAIWIGVYLGLVMHDPQAVAAVHILVWPFGFLSAAFVAPDSMPGWLGTLAEWNPMSSTVVAVRELLGNPGWGGDSWVVEHAELMAVLWPLALTALFLPLAARRYRRLGD